MTKQQEHSKKSATGMQFGARSPDCAVLHCTGRTAPSFRAIDQLLRQYTAGRAPNKQPRTAGRAK